MFSPLLFTTLLAALAAVRADPDPSEPGPGSVYNEGATCHIAWTPDTTGTWKTMNIELMTGNNLQMVHITTVATVDGTDATKASYDYPCPEVTPNSAIYFYQFTSPAASTTLWTTRFAIADANGNTTPPTNATEPDGKPIPWGTGALVDPSKAVPPPGQSSGLVVPASTSAAAGGSSGSSGASAPSTSSSVSSSASSASVSPSPARLPASSGSGSSKGSSTVSVTGSSSTSAVPTGAAATNGAVGAFGAGSRVAQAVGTLAMVAFGFAVAL